MAKLFRNIKPLGIKTNIFSLLAAFYIGSQSHYLVNRVENSLLYKNVPYSSDSYTGILEIDQVINEQGELEQRLKNSDTGKYYYTIGPDLMPDDIFLSTISNEKKEQEVEKGINPIYPILGSALLFGLYQIFRKKQDVQYI